MGTSLGVADTMALIAVEVEQPGAVYDLRALPARGSGRLAALPVCHRRRRRAPSAAGGQERPRTGRLGGPQPACAGERAAERRSGSRRASGETTLQSALVCPLVFNDRLIGTLALYHTEPGRFTDDHRRLLDRVAEQAAAVVNNSIVFEQTKRDSLTDPLTGLPNTRFMFVHLTRELARAERLKTEVSLLVMDLDGFKEINDMHGHHVGDKALREVARVLRTGIRPVRRLRPLCGRRVRRRPVGMRSRRGRAEAARTAAGDRGHPVRGQARPVRSARELVRIRCLPARRTGLRDAAGDRRRADVSGQGAAQEPDGRAKRACGRPGGEPQPSLRVC